MRRGITAALSVLGVAAACAAALGQPTKGREYATGTPFITVNGVTEFVRKAMPGALGAEVAGDSAGMTKGPARRAAGAKYGPIEVFLEPSDLPQLGQSLMGSTATRFSGRIGVAGADQKVRRAMDFKDAVVMHWELCELDGASNESVTIRVVLQPASATVSAGGEAAPTPSLARQKATRAANFRLTIPGMDCKRVAKIHPVVVERRAADAPAQHGNLRFEVAGVDAQPFIDWYASVVQKGVQDAGATKTAKIELLDMGMKSALGTLDATGVNIVGIELGEFAMGSERAERVTVECLVQKWTYKEGKEGESKEPPPAKAPPK